MLERVPDTPGGLLDLQGYLDDFARRFRDARAMWKLERGQTFREPEVPSWRALEAGDWARSLQLIEQMRQQFVAEADNTASAAINRIRIVEKPITPYLQWEMHILKLRAETGGGGYVVLDAAAVRHLEMYRPLPELVVLDSSVVYEVVYDESGTPVGARHIDNTDIVGPCRDELSDLFDIGEDLQSYFTREIVPLPPPVDS